MAYDSGITEKFIVRLTDSQSGILIDYLLIYFSYNIGDEAGLIYG
jgi:hypothetical protein